MAGWGFPQWTRKAHYFNDEGMALCRKWGLYRGPTEDSNHESSDNCAACKRLREHAAISAGGSRDGEEGE